MTNTKCDRCPAEAQVGVDLLSGGTLYFCQHHYNENRDALAPVTVFAGRLGELAGVLL